MRSVRRASGLVQTASCLFVGRRVKFGPTRNSPVTGTGFDGNIDLLGIPFTRAATGRVIGQRAGANDSS
jgi:hypothetical protein